MIILCVLKKKMCVCVCVYTVELGDMDQIPSSSTRYTCVCVQVRMPVCLHILVSCVIDHAMMVDLWYHDAL